MVQIFVILLKRTEVTNIFKEFCRGMTINKNHSFRSFFLPINPEEKSLWRVLLQIILLSCYFLRWCVFRLLFHVKMTLFLKMSLVKKWLRGLYKLKGACWHEKWKLFLWRIHVLRLSFTFYFVFFFNILIMQVEEQWYDVQICKNIKQDVFLYSI